MRSIKMIGAILIAAGFSIVTAHIFYPLPYLSGGGQLALILGSLGLGGLLLFISRFLGRPAGIDNDKIYQKSLTGQGIIGIGVGIVLTFFYIVIYLGDRFQIGPVERAQLLLSGSGEILEANDPQEIDLLQYCPACQAEGQATGEGALEGALLLQQQNIGDLFPGQGSLQEKFRKISSGGNSEERLSFSGDYRFSIAITAISPVVSPVDQSPRFMAAIERSDSLHHWFSRHLYGIADPLAWIIQGEPASNWFFYSMLYTFAILLFGCRMFLKYRHNRYQIIRTASIMFFQLGFAFLLPNLLKLFRQPEYYFSYFWPLKYEYLYPATWFQAIQNGGVGAYFLAWGAFMTVIGTPTLTYFFGKRWYCSWVCGCGGLAETMGDPFRQLSSKSLRSWKIERYMIHSVLALISITTLALWSNSLTSGAIFGGYSQKLSEIYGLYIGAIFSGIIGVGFYPLLGTRLWCRFGCPLAAILGMLQKWFSRFRITTNGGQCISCGNCSTYCEMGIDVRWYAQRQQNIIRSSCVGCGVCAAVCPRGVLKLENGVTEGRYNG